VRSAAQPRASLKRIGRKSQRAKQASRSLLQARLHGFSASPQSRQSFRQNRRSPPHRTWHALRRFAAASGECVSHGANAPAAAASAAPIAPRRDDLVIRSSGHSPLRSTSRASTAIALHPTTDHIRRSAFDFRLRQQLPRHCDMATRQPCLHKSRLSPSRMLQARSQVLRLLLQRWRQRLRRRL
jgi:hypothetical protein